MFVKASAVDSSHSIPHSFEHLGSRVIVSSTTIIVLDKHSDSAYDATLKQREFNTPVSDRVCVDILCTSHGRNE